MSVQHKNIGLEKYMNSISKNLDEKWGLMDYMQRKLQGNYLEIGVGGYKDIEKKLYPFSSSQKLVYYFCDCSQEILDDCKKKNSLIKAFSPAEGEQKRTNGLTIKMIRANACQLPFGDRTISGINMSSVFHEIFSYCGEGALQQAFEECFRVLEPGGILVYRDPEQRQDRREEGILEIHSPLMQHFIDLFLPLFLDQTLTLRKNSNGKIIKPHHYTIEGVTIRREQGKTRIYAQRGLLNEITRHFLTFLHDNESSTLLKILGDGIHINGILFSTSFFCLWYEKFLAKGLSFNFDDPAIISLLQRCMREAEEYYFYMSPDELITSVLARTFEKKKGAVLFPLDLKKNTHHPRKKYLEILYKNCSLFDDRGLPLKQHEGKRIIHFAKIAPERAFIIAHKLIKEEENSYPLLKKFITEQWTDELYHGHG